MTLIAPGSGGVHHDVGGKDKLDVLREQGEGAPHPAITSTPRGTSKWNMPSGNQS